MAALSNGATCPKIFVGGLSWETSVENLKEHFTTYGQVMDVMMPRDKDSGRSRGFGFVTFSRIEEADAALGVEHTLAGRKLNLNPAVAERADVNASEPTKRLFIGDLLTSSTDEELKAAFERFGALEDAVIMRHPETNESRGFGFVTYETVEAAELALAEGEVPVGQSMAKITKAAPKGKGGKGKGEGKGKGYGKGFDGWGKGGKGGYDGGWGKGGKGGYDGGWGKGGYGYDGGWGGGWGGKGGYGGPGGYGVGPGGGGRGGGPGYDMAAGGGGGGYGGGPQHMSAAPPNAYAPPALPELPDGWQAAYDDHGRQYFYHHPTKTSQWEPPPRPVGAAAAMQPPSQGYGGGGMPIAGGYGMPGGAEGYGNPRYRQGGRPY